MTSCLARQPIFDRKLNTIGNELLYRSSVNSQVYDASNPDQATSATLTLGLELDIRRLTDNRLAFVNFTENTLLNESGKHFAPKAIWSLRFWENIKPDAKNVKACKELKKEGYHALSGRFQIQRRI
jgi:EAL and modified HD-GYP domain-containing signal transduction protein